MPIAKEDVIAVWLAGSSSGRIANRFGISRSAVAGIVHRWKQEQRDAGLPLPPPRASNFGMMKKHKAKPKPKPVMADKPKPVGPTPLPPPAPPEPEPTGPGLWVPLLETGNKTCRMSHDGVLFCNAPTGGGPWCQYHSRGLNMPTPKRRAA